MVKVVKDPKTKKPFNRRATVTKTFGVGESVVSFASGKGFVYK
jgi:hypothetical protein